MIEGLIRIEILSSSFLRAGGRLSWWLPVLNEFKNNRFFAFDLFLAWIG